MNKAQTSGELILWLYRFLLIAAISFALVIIVGNKYTAKFDIRQTESAILSEKIFSCISDREISSNQLKNCLGINEFDYYISANLTSLDSNFSKMLILGNSDLKVQCSLIKSGTRFAKPAQCSEFNYIGIIDDERIKEKIEIDIGKHDKNLQ